MTTDPAALRAQSLCDVCEGPIGTREDSLPDTPVEFRDSAFCWKHKGGAHVVVTMTAPKYRAAIRAAVESERARAETAEKARDDALMEADNIATIARDGMRALEARAETAEKALRGVVQEAWYVLSGGDDPREQCGWCGAGGYGRLRELLREAVPDLATAPPPRSAEQQEEPRCNCPDIGWARDCPKHGPEEGRQETLSGAPAARPAKMSAEERANGIACRGAAHFALHTACPACIAIAIRAAEAAAEARALSCPDCGGPVEITCNSERCVDGAVRALAQGNAADRPPPALPVEQNRAPDGASLDDNDRRTMEAWRSYFLELCDALFPESIGRPHLLGWRHVIARAHALVTRERARSAPPALSPSVPAAASAEKQEGRPSGLILPNDEKHGAWCIFDGPQWGCDFCCEPEGRVIEALRSEARICSACVSLAGDLEPRERASPEAPTSTENTSETPK